MNAPNFSFDGDGRSHRLPSTAAHGSPSITHASREVSVNFDTQKFDTQDESESDFRQSFFKYLGLALKYRWLILTFCGLALAIGFIVTFTTTPLYHATVTIQIDLQAQQVVKLEGGPNREFVDNLRFYQTQYDLLRSRSLAERVAADLNLAATPDFLHPPSTSAWEKLGRLIFSSTNTATTATEDKGNFAQSKDATASMVQSGLSVMPVPNSSLVRVSFDSPSPVWAQRIANGVADSYTSSNLERRYGATAYARNFLKERLDELKLKLEESEKAVVAYADEKELIDTASANTSNIKGSKESLGDSDLAALNAALQKVVTERIAAQELWEQANDSDGFGLPQILSDRAIGSLREHRATLMIEYQNKLSTFKPAYPDMQKLKAQIDQIGQEIKSAIDVIKKSLKARYESALQTEVLLKKKMDETKRGVLDTRNKEIQFNILKREADTNRTLYEGLLQQYKDAGIAGAVGTNNVAVIDRAQLPGGPFKPNLQSNLLKSLILGLLATAFAIALFEILDDTFKSPEEIEEQLGLAVLGVIPLSDGNVLANIKELSNPLAEAFRSFRTALQFSTDQGAPKTILVTSSRPGEGKSTTAWALAVNFAQLGMKVLLVDADLRNPSQHRNLKRKNGVGLANYLAGGVLAGSIFQETDVEGLYFTPSGPLPPNPAELLAGPKMMSLLSTASEKVDIVIVDSPPVMGLADAPLLASIALGTLLVVSATDTRRGVVKDALKRLHFARARMLGTVMNKCDFGRRYGHSYGYGYGSGYAALEYYGYGQKTKPAQVEHTPGD